MPIHVVEVQKELDVEEALTMNPVGDVLCRLSVQDEYVEQALVRSSDESLLDSSCSSEAVH